MSTMVTGMERSLMGNVTLKDEDFEKYLLTAQEVGRLKGMNQNLAEQCAELHRDFKYKQEECDELRARAAAAERELGVLQKTFEQIERIKL